MGDIKKTVKAYRKYRLEKLAEKTDFNYLDLDANQENQILNYILNMPIKRQNLLVFKNYYKHTFDEIAEILDIENPKGEYLHLVGILSESIDLENAMISENSMQKVCQSAAEKINEEIMKDFEQFNNEFKSVRNNRKRPRFTSHLSSKVASVALIFLISSALLVGANAYAQGKIFKWIVKTFEEYTSFNIAEEDVFNKGDFSIKIGYVPEGFELEKKTLSDSSDFYYYENGNEFLIINFLYDNIKTELNTENVIKEEFELDDIKVITWEKDNQNYFVLNIKGVPCVIYGDISKEEFIKIYNDISLH